MPWDYRGAFGSIGSYGAGTVVAKLASPGTLQRMARVTQVSIQSVRSNLYEVIERDRNGSNVVVRFPILHPGTLNSQPGQTVLRGNVDHPLAEVAAGKNIALRAVTARGVGAAAPINIHAFHIGLFSKSAVVGSVGP